MKKFILILFVLLFGFSAYLNYKSFTQKSDEPWFVHFNDANTRITYETAHSITDAQKIATGKGIKVGILGKYFGVEKHPELYTGSVDFTGDKDALNTIDEHGMWMATTLKEIAPNVEVYALNARNRDKTLEADAFEKAIDWAIDKKLNILTYSAEAFLSENRSKIDAAVKKAHSHGIVTTFIHYPEEGNILPWTLSNYKEGIYTRTPDIKIYHYDYNSLLLFKYKRYIQNNRPAEDSGDRPFYSVSSTSPVLAGIIAMMMEIKPGLTPTEYKDILVQSSKSFNYKGKQIEGVADAFNALTSIKEE